MSRAQDVGQSFNLHLPIFTKRKVANASIYIQPAFRRQKKEMPGFVWSCWTSHLESNGVFLTRIITEDALTDNKYKLASVSAMSTG